MDDCLYDLFCNYIGLEIESEQESDREDEDEDIPYKTDEESDVSLLGF